MLGLFGLAFLILTVLLTVVAIRWKQRFAPYIFAAGTVLVLTIVFTIYTGQIAIYQSTGISIYIGMMLAILLLFCGGLGLAANGARLLFAWFNRRHTQPVIR